MFKIWIEIISVVVGKNAYEQDILAEDKTKMKSNTAPYTLIKNLVIKPDGGGSYL